MALHSTTKKPLSPSTTVPARFCRSGRGVVADDDFPEKGDDVDLRDLGPSSSPDTATFSSIRTSFGSTRASSLTSPQRMGRDGCGGSSRTGSIEGPRPSLVLDLYGSSASMSALPESLSFSIACDGRWITAWSSARVYLLDAQELPQVRGRSFQLRHRVTAADAVRNGKLVAILSRRCQVELLRVDPGRPTEPAAILRSIVLSDESGCIALAPDGSLLAAGTAHGIELVSLKDTPPSWPDRRTVACDGMDSLAFTPDSKSLIATSYVGSRKLTTLFTVTRDFNPECLDMDAERDANPLPNHLTWIREVLFPETSPGAQQAAYLQSCTSGSVNYLFSFNNEKAAWGIYDMVQKKHIQTKPAISQASDCTERAQTEEALPALSASIPYAAVAMTNAYRSFVWFYALPDDLNEDRWSYAKSLGGRTPPKGPAFARAIPKPDTSVPMNITSLKWIEPSHRDNPWRRIIAAGHLRSQTTPTADLEPALDNPMGKIVIIDVHKTENQGVSSLAESLALNIDDYMSAQVIPQKELAFDREVELARRRTLVSTGTPDRMHRVRASMHEAPLRRARTDATSPGPPSARSQSVSAALPEDGHGEAMLPAEEARAALEEPYANTAPRSHATLHRASTIAAVAPANRRHLHALPHQPLPINPANGQPDPPHESDADNWVPPPPAYNDHKGDQLVAASAAAPRSDARSPAVDQQPSHPFARRRARAPTPEHRAEDVPRRQSTIRRTRDAFRVPRRPLTSRSVSETTSDRDRLSPTGIANIPGSLNIASVAQPSPGGPRATYHPGSHNQASDQLATPNTTTFAQPSPGGPRATYQPARIDTSVSAAPVMQATYTPVDVVETFDNSSHRVSVPVFHSLPSSEQFEALSHVHEEPPLPAPGHGVSASVSTSAPSDHEGLLARRRRGQRSLHRPHAREPPPSSQHAPQNRHTLADTVPTEQRRSYERAWADLFASSHASPPPRASTVSPAPRSPRYGPPSRFQAGREPSAFEETNRRSGLPRVMTMPEDAGVGSGRAARKYAKGEKPTKAREGKLKKPFKCVVM